MKIFFIGVCGTATGNVAILMKKLGHDVLGSDRGMYEPMKSALANAGVAAYENWDAKKLEAFAPDLVVVGNAISRMNPELEFVLSHPQYAFSAFVRVLSSAEPTARLRQPPPPHTCSKTQARTRAG